MQSTRQEGQLLRRMDEIFGMRAGQHQEGKRFPSVRGVEDDLSRC